MELENIGSYWNLRAEGYSQSNMSQYKSEAKDYWTDLLLSNAPKGDLLRCLDIGCGPGFLGILMAERGHNVTSIDYSEEMLNRAKNNMEATGVSLCLHKMDAQNLDFGDNTFDYIFCRDLAWNLERPERAYEEWLRVLAPGGRLLVADSNHYLHYHNSDFAEERESRTDITHPDLLGVDPTPIDNIARDLPLSRECRPAWDINTLLFLGADKAGAVVQRRRYISPTTQEEKSLIYTFVITAEKSTQIKEGM